MLLMSSRIRACRCHINNTDSWHPCTASSRWGMSGCLQGMEQVGRCHRW